MVHLCNSFRTKIQSALFSEILPLLLLPEHVFACLLAEPLCSLSVFNFLLLFFKIVVMFFSICVCVCAVKVLL